MHGTYSSKEYSAQMLGRLPTMKGADSGILGFAKGLNGLDLESIRAGVA
ncbi:MAG: hypothetical protein NZ954_03130 [Thermofilaceae archaeon]|nr:hypothetical protein [Thermofilaceae archaeon]MCX8181049.1 hypothetical protein [Thermofilaceae archaeon]MDW8004530.1 hypothetical protein [Thermofilaceae archaeon]